MLRFKYALLIALAVPKSIAAHSLMQALSPPQPVVAPATTSMPAVKPNQEIIEFAADELSYSDNEQAVVGTGHVNIMRDGYWLTADEVRYDRSTGVIEARGNVIVKDKKGSIITAEKMQLTESLRDAVVENVQLLLEDGARFAALRGQRTENKTNIERAVYSPCIVCTADGKERPLWRLKALKVELNESKKRIYFNNAYLDFFGISVAYIPFLSIPSSESTRASGFLVPQIKQARELGFAIATPYFIALAPWRDLTITPSIYTSERPALSAEYREQLRQGPVRIGGTLTYARRLDDNSGTMAQNKLRGYGYADASLLHNKHWRSSFSLRLATDDTFLRRYEISNDDTLRGRYALERFDDNSYFSAEILEFQTLRNGRDQATVPLALPVLHYWWRSKPWIAGGRWTVNANTASIIRIKGADTWRATVGTQYDVPYINNLGMAMKGTGYARSDLYYQNDASQQDSGAAVYAGKDGFEARGVGALAGEVRWPLTWRWRISNP
jgi:LPS-assembly protein